MSMQICETQSAGEDVISLVIDLNLYSLTAVKKCCYKFTADCSIQIDIIDQDKLRLIFNFPVGTREDAKNKLLCDFHNELLDQDLREIISKETEQVRNLILAEAFSKTSILES